MHQDIFKSYIKAVVRQLEPELIHSLEELTATAAQPSSLTTPLLDRFSLVNAGGKRVRSALVALGWEIATNSPAPLPLIKAGVAYEIVQTAILAHDDMMDRSELRRGMPTLEYQLESGHRGRSLALVLADMGYFWGFQSLSELDLSPEVIVQGMRSFASGMVKTGIGQLYDVELTFRTSFTEADALKAIEWKTAFYTVTAPIRMGAAYAGASKEFLDALEPFTQAAGIVFQIVDDILGVFGEEDETKKSVSSDILEGKRTVLAAYVEIYATGADRELYDRYYGNREITPEQVAEIRELFKRSGAYDHTMRLAQAYADQALGTLDTIEGITDEHRAILHDMVLFFLTRSA